MRSTATENSGPRVWWLLVVVVALLATACGDDSDDGSVGGDDDPAPVELSEYEQDESARSCKEPSEVDGLLVDLSDADRSEAAELCGTFDEADGPGVEIVACPDAQGWYAQSENMLVVEVPADDADAVNRVVALAGGTTAAAGDVLIVSFDADVQSARQLVDLLNGIGEVVAAPSTLFQLHPITRGFPVEDFIPAGSTSPTGPDPFALAGLSGDDPSPVVIIDVDSAYDGTRINGHGRFIQKIVEQLGAPADIAAIAPDAASGNLAYFSEAEIVRALEESRGTWDMDDAPVVNMSLGGQSCGLAPTALTRAIARGVKSGAHFVASAGNDETNEPTFPAALGVGTWKDLAGSGVDDLSADVTSVGSIDLQGNRSCYSNYGPWVESWAVGERVQTADGWWSGTSFAAPQIAAEVAFGITGGAGNPPANLTTTVASAQGDTFCSANSPFHPDNS